MNIAGTFIFISALSGFIKVSAEGRLRSVIDLTLATLFFSEKKYTIYNHTASFDLKQNNLLTTLPYLGKEYEVLFQLKITNIASAAYQSVLHLSVDGTDVGVYGSRSPALWVKSDKKFHVSSAISGNKNNWANIPGAKMHEWLSIEISQTLRDKKVNVDNHCL